jgi:putative ABC transport system substrate-binding protein
MKRRHFITLLGGVAAAWPLAARAQQPTLPVIGFLGSGSSVLFASRVSAFRQGLSEAGYVEGRNAAIEFRWAESRNDRLPALAADLVGRNVNVIVTAGGTPAARAAKAATTAIPIVFGIGNDPVQMGLITSLNRPDGNMTGVTSLSGEIGPKRLELLHEVVPTATSIALLVNPTNPAAETQSTELQPAARTLGLQLYVLRASAERDFDAAFASLVQLRAGGLVIVADAVFNTRSEQLAALTLHHAVPAAFQYREFAAAGGLMSYGDSATEEYRQMGVYAGRILNGEKPGDLPVQQATKVELIINLKTAKALGITVPQLLLGRADEVIE